MGSTKLSFLPYLQHWDGTRLKVRLLAVPGLGPVKADRYGDALLALVGQHAPTPASAGRAG